MGAGKDTPLTLSWEDGVLTIHGEDVPGGQLEINYLEAYCRPGSTDRAWGETVIGHTTKLVEASEDGRALKLRCTLKDGVTLEHVITSSADEVDFRLVAHNPTDTESEAHWAQPCIRVGAFSGLADHQDPYEYTTKCFIFLDGELARMPTEHWATEARYTPGQVWCPAHVPRDDVNPRPLNPDVPTGGLIGCFSADEKMILATAWEPYQELFQGVIQCIHSDFRIGGLAPGETKQIRGKIYLVESEVEALVRRYERDFPEHLAGR